MESACDLRNLADLDLHRAYRFPGHVPIGIEGLIPISFPQRAKAKVLDAVMMAQS